MAGERVVREARPVARTRKRRLGKDHLKHRRLADCDGQAKKHQKNKSGPRPLDSCLVILGIFAFQTAPWSMVQGLVPHQAGTLSSPKAAGHLFSLWMRSLRCLIGCYYRLLVKAARGANQAAVDV